MCLSSLCCTSSTQTNFNSPPPVYNACVENCDAKVEPSTDHWLHMATVYVLCLAILSVVGVFVGVSVQLAESTDKKEVMQRSEKQMEALEAEKRVSCVT